MANNTTPPGAFTRTGMISGVGLAGTDYTRKGVVDQSGYFAGQAAAQGKANDIADLRLIGQGVEAGLNTVNYVGRGLVLGSIEDQTQELVDNFTSTINGPTEMLALDNTSNSLWANLGDKDKPSNISDINTIDQKHAATVDKLTKAYKQGAISNVAELEARVLQVTREAVNRTPGMAAEIMQHSQRVLHLSGVRGMVNPMEEQAKIQAKQAAKLEDQLTAYHTQHGIPFNPLAKNIPEMAAQMQQHLIGRQAYEEAKRDADANNLLEQHLTKQFMREDLPNINRGAYSQVSEAAAQIFAPGVPYEQSITAFRKHIEDAKFQLNDIYTKNNALSDANGRKIYDVTAKSLDSLLTTVESFQNGDEALKYIQNSNNLMMRQQERGVMENVNIPAMKAMSYLPDVARMQAWKANPGLTQGLAAALISGVPSAAMWEGENYIDGVNDVTAMTGAFVRSNQSEQASNAFAAVARGVNNMAPKERMLKLTEHFKELAKSEYKGKIKEADPGFLSSFQNSAENYLQDVGRMFNQSIQDANSRLGMSNEALRFGLPAVENAVGIGEGQAVSARVFINSGGLVGIETTNDPSNKYRDQWKDAVTDRYNNVIKTYANVAGVSVKEASDIVMSRYGTMLNIPEEELPKSPRPPLVSSAPVTGARGQNANNPLNLKEVGKDRFRSFASKQEGIQASYNQLLKYHDGSSANVDFPTTSPKLMLRVWNNQAEKGSASDSTYANNVARLGGIDLEQPIDRNDKDTWADLLYGMALAEGAKGITRKEIRVALMGGN